MRYTEPTSTIEDTEQAAAELALFVASLQAQGYGRVENESSIVPALTAAEREVEDQTKHEEEQEYFARAMRVFQQKALQRWRCVRVFLGCGAVSLGLGVSALADWISVDNATLPLIVFALPTVVAALLGMRLHGQMTTLIAQLPETDVRAIGPLLEALHYADMDGIPQRLLCELLPCVRPEDGVLFTDAHRVLLCRALKETNTDVVVHVLHALEKIGDARAIHAVQPFAQGQGSARYDRRVQDAAARCLATLEARVVHGNSSQTLLRASDVPLIPGRQLLRPAMETETTAGELLRAVAPDV